MDDFGQFQGHTEPHASFNANIFSIGGPGTATYLLMSLPLAWRLHMHTKTEFSRHYHENGQSIIVERYARTSDGAIFVLVEARRQTNGIYNRKIPQRNSSREFPNRKRRSSKLELPKMRRAISLSWKICPF